MHAPSQIHTPTRLQRMTPMTLSPCALVVGLLGVACTDALHRAGLSVIAVPSLLAGEALAKASLSPQLMDHPTIILLQPQDLTGVETWPLAAQLTLWMQEGSIRPASMVMLADDLSDHGRRRAERAGCRCLSTPYSDQEVRRVLALAVDPVVDLQWIDPDLDPVTASRLIGERTFFLEAAVVAYHSLRDSQKKHTSAKTVAVDTDDIWAVLRLFLTPAGYVRDAEALQRGMTVVTALGGEGHTRHLLHEFEGTLSGIDKAGVSALVGGAGRAVIAKLIGIHIDNVSRVWLRKTIAPRFVQWLLRQQSGRPN